MISTADLDALYQEKYLGGQGWGPRMRRRFGYFNPDDHYETLLDGLITPQDAWLDIGCGRTLFPSNEPLARSLAGRCRRLVGVDPSPNIRENPYLDDRAEVPLDAYAPNETFDVITCRMVAEHVGDPQAFAAALARLAHAGTRVVIYTVYRWSPGGLLADLVPFRWHQPVKRWFWSSEDRDTFPVHMRLNTRGALRRALAPQGFREEAFSYLADCRTFGAFRHLLWLDLAAWRLLGPLHPEKCVLGLYRFDPATSR